MIRTLIGASWRQVTGSFLNTSRQQCSGAIGSLKLILCDSPTKSQSYFSTACRGLCLLGTTKRPELLLPVCNSITQKRDVTKFSLQKGKQKTVKAVLKRFYRLNWGVWIRGKCGRHKRLHTKSANRKRRLRQHVFTNATQSNLLDKMVTKYWKKPKYYVDDPYEPYQTREEFSLTRKKPYAPLE